MAELEHGSEVSLDQIPQTVQGVEFTPLTQTEIAQEDPFGDSKQLSVDKPINVTQLQDELSEVTGMTVSLSLIWPEGEPKGVLHVSPGGVDGRTVVGKLRSHEPDPLYGLTEAERAQAEIMGKVRRGERLEPEEMTLALQALAGQRR
jgi:hypothetical protein